MGGPVKKKLCWNCDASVPLESETCIYCGVSIASAIPEGDEEEPKIATPPPLYGKPPSRAASAASGASSASAGSTASTSASGNTSKNASAGHAANYAANHTNTSAGHAASQLQEQAPAMAQAREMHTQSNKKRPIPPQPAFRGGKPTLKIREESQSSQAEDAVALQKKPHALLSLFLMLTGSTFFLFGLVIFLFSDQGALILRWNRDQALIYLGLGVCALFAGWRFILRLEE